MEKKILENLNSLEFQHPFDIKAINMLKDKKALQVLIEQFNKHGIERILRIQYTGSNLRLNETVIPDAYCLLLESCKILDIDIIPELYVVWDYSMNAFTAGVDKTIIVLNSGCLDLLPKEELAFILGHEAGHIKCKHVLYSEMATVFPMLVQIIGNVTLGIGGLLATGIEVALLNWMRMAEFSADRAGLLACQDINIAIKALSKMAGMPKKYFDSVDNSEFIKQAKDFKDYDYDTLDKVAKTLSIMFQTHPWTVMRAAELIKWVDSGEYERVLNRSSIGSFCKGCGIPRQGAGQFCVNCGKQY